MTIEAVTRQREELGTQLARLRRSRGHTQTSLSRKLGYARVTITMAEQGHPAGREFWQCCDQELATGGQLVAAYDQIDDLRRRITRPRTSPEQAPQESDKNMTQANDAQIGSVTSLISWLSSSTASDETINDLACAAFGLTVAHPKTPARIILADVLSAHQELAALRRAGKLRLSQERALFKIDADLLAHACLLYGDLNQHADAELHGKAALLCAREAETNEAFAWSSLAKTARWQGKFLRSADLARQGFEHVGTSPIRAQLAYYEAHGAALLGDADRAREAQRRAEQAADEAGMPDGELTVWSFTPERRALFTMAVSTRLGDAKTALRVAQVADEGWASGDPWAPATWAQIRMGSALAHLWEGELEGATNEVNLVLARVTPEYRIATVTGYAVELAQKLGDARFKNDKQAVELCQQVRAFSTEALPSKQSPEAQ